MDAHLEAIPGLGTLTARGLTGSDAEDLGGHADGAPNLDVLALALGSGNELSADLLEVLDVAAGEGHADLKEVGLGGLDLLIGRHFYGLVCKVSLIWSILIYREKYIFLNKKWRNYPFFFFFY